MMVHDVNDLIGAVAAATYNSKAVTSIAADPTADRDIAGVDAETALQGHPGPRVDIVSTVEDPNTKSQKAEIIVHHRGGRRHEGAGQGRMGTSEEMRASR